MRKIFFATGNQGKLNSAKKMLGKYYDIEGIKLNIEEPQSLDQEYVAKYKVDKAFEILKAPVFCEDLGMYIEKYNNFPGIMTAYVLEGIGLCGLTKLFEESEPAYYKTTIAYKDSNNEFTTSVIMKGKLTIKNISKKYDPATSKNLIKNIFIPDGYTKVINDLTDKERYLLPYNLPLYKELVNKIEENNGK